MMSVLTLKSEHDFKYVADDGFHDYWQLLGLP